MSYKIAVVGATGNVGREILKCLVERNFPYKEVVALASRDSIGREVTFGDKLLRCQSLESYNFAGTDIAFFSAGGRISAEYVPKAAEKDCVCIDNTSYFRMHNNIPLIIPEVNLEAINNFKETNIIANPNCSTIQLLMALKPLSKLAKIKRVVVTTLQSVSGAGKEAMDELFAQTKNIYSFSNKGPKIFPKQIAFNAIPQINTIMSDGTTEEENKIVNETKKILDKDIEVSATCVRVPIFIGHAVSANIEFASDIDLKKAEEEFDIMPGVSFVDTSNNGSFITPVECVGEDNVYISRLRKDNSTKNAINIWIVADNLRKGAALNAIQIGEEVIKILDKEKAPKLAHV